MNNHLSPQMTEHTKNHVRKPGSGLVYVQKCVVIKPVTSNGITIGNTNINKRQQNLHIYAFFNRYRFLKCITVMNDFIML